MEIEKLFRKCYELKTYFTYTFTLPNGIPSVHTAYYTDTRIKIIIVFFFSLNIVLIVRMM